MNSKKDSMLMFRWLLLRPMLRFKGMYSLVVVLNVLSTLFQLAGMLTLIKIFTLFRNDWQLVIRGFEYDLLDHKRLAFIGISSLSLMLMGFAAAFRYWSRIAVTKIARRCEEYYNIELTKSYMSKFYTSDSSLASNSDLNSMQGYYARGGRYVGRAIMAIASSIIPAVTAIVSFVAMINMKPAVTAAFLVVLVLVIPFYIRIIRKSSELSGVLSKEARAATIGRIRLLNGIRLAPSLKKASEFQSGSINKSSSMQNFLNAYEFRLQIGTLVSSFTQGVQTVMILVILIGSAYPLLNNATTSEISGVLVYLAAFKLFGSGLQSMMNTLVMTNLFYSYSAPMIGFLEASRELDSREKPSLPGSRNVFEKGRDFAISINQELDWPAIGWVLSLMGLHVDTESLESVRLLNCSWPASSDDLFESLGVQKNFSFSELSEWNPEIARRVKKPLEEAIEKSRQLKWRKEDWDKFAATAKLACFTYAVKDIPSSLILFIDGKTLSNFDLSEKKALFDALSWHTLIFFYRNSVIPADLEQAGVRTAFYINKKGIYWQGPAGESNAQLLRQSAAADFEESAPEDDLDMML